MIIGIGSDIVDIRRIEKLCVRFGAKFEMRIFTPEEIARADMRGRAGKSARYASLAKRFAAKEACAKALGTGIGEYAGWRDISVSNLPGGAASLALSGKAAENLDKKLPPGMKAVLHISMSDDYPFALSFVVISAENL